MYGKKLATQFAEYLSKKKFIITSGLAEGIDTYAHQGAILAKNPTLAVMGTGINIIYPYQNQSLADDILNNDGALITEFFPQEPPRACNFPRRNRLISGLSLGVLIVEASLHSGSLITARHALAQGRDVYAVPNAITYSGCKGCHYLIQQGAKLISCIEDVLIELQTTPLRHYLKPKYQKIFSTNNDVHDSLNLNLQKNNKKSTTNSCELIALTEGLGKTQQKLLALVASGFSNLEELAQESKLSAACTAAAIIELETMGLIVYTWHGYELTKKGY